MLSFGIDSVGNERISCEANKMMISKQSLCQTDTR